MGAQPARAEPRRTCVGCRRVAPRRELVRFVAGPDGPVEGAGRPGRGAWLCPDPDCLERAARRGALARALRIEPATVAPAVPALREALLRAATQRGEQGAAGE